jgi:HEAT repeat protein
VPFQVPARTHWRALLWIGVCGAVLVGVMAVPQKRSVPSGPSGGGAAHEQVLSIVSSGEVDDARRHLIELGPEAIDPVVEILSGTGPDRGASRIVYGRKAVLYDALAAWPMDLVVEGVARRARAESSFGARLAAIGILGRVGDAGALEHILTILSAADPVQLRRTFVQRQLEGAIGAIAVRDSRCSWIIARRLDDTPPELWAPLARALGLCLRQGGVRVLERMLGHGRDLDALVLEQVSRLDVRDLAALRDETAGIVRGYLNDVEPRLRKQAAVSIGRLHDVESIEALIGLLEDPEPSVTAAALHGLRAISGLSWAVESTRWSEWLRQESAWIEAELPRLERDAAGSAASAVAALREISHHPLFRARAARAPAAALEHADAGVAAFACSVLASLESASALPYLIEALRHSDETVRLAAHRALHSITGRAFSLEYETWKAWLDA